MITEVAVKPYFFYNYSVYSSDFIINKYFYNFHKTIQVFVAYITGTCFIQKIYAPSSSLLQDKHLPFSPSPLRVNMFRLFVILSLTQLYRYTPEIFLFSTATFKYIRPSYELDKTIQRTSHGLFFSHWGSRLCFHCFQTVKHCLGSPNFKFLHVCSLLPNPVFVIKQ